jgi:hypothetical protein
MARRILADVSTTRRFDRLFLRLEKQILGGFQAKLRTFGSRS